MMGVVSSAAVLGVAPGRGKALFLGSGVVRWPQTLPLSVFLETVRLQHAIISAWDVVGAGWASCVAWGIASGIPLAWAHPHGSFGCCVAGASGLVSGKSLPAPSGQDDPPCHDPGDADSDWHSFLENVCESDQAEEEAKQRRAAMAAARAQQEQHDLAALLPNLMDAP